MSMPSAMGIQKYFPVEWWYFSGYVNVDNDTISIMIANIKYRNIATMNSYGIGINKKFHSGYTIAGAINNIFNNGLFVETPTLNNVNVSFVTNNTKFSFVLINGTMGENSEYSMNFENNKFKFGMTLTDNYGCIFEGNKGYIANESVEYGFPRLNISSGSFTSNESTSIIKFGNIWYDRQLLLNKIMRDGFNTMQLYNGVWFYIVTDNISLQMAFIYNKLNNDINWIIGEKVNNPPILKMGLDFTNISVITFTNNTNYDVCVFNDKDPQISPHWTSPKSLITYGMKWIVTYNEYKFVIVADYEAEIDALIGHAFEGSTKIYDTIGIQIGYGFMEQMLG
jgi:predicted secreted hydrolase